MFSSDDAVELFNQIATFSKMEDVEFHLRNGLDLRTAPDDKVQALRNDSHAFTRLHCAWDMVQNTFIF